MRFSVIIATFNRASILRLVLDALAVQTYSNYEVVVVDDGSTDETSPVVHSYHFAHYIAQPHLSTPKLFNIGWRNSSGDIILMSDDDYISPPNLIAGLADAFHRYPEVAAVGCYANPPDNLLASNRFARYDHWEWCFHGGKLTEYVGGAETPTAGAVAYKRSVLEEIGGFNENLLITGAHDHDMKRRLTGRGYKFAYVPIKIEHYRLFTESSFQQQHIGRGRAVARYELVTMEASPSYMRIILRALKRMAVLLKNLLVMHDKALAWTIFQAGWFNCIGQWREKGAQGR